MHGPDELAGRPHQLPHHRPGRNGKELDILRLWTVDERFGVTVLDLLKEGRFGEAGGRADGKRSPGYHPIPLSREARNARRPQAPALLLEADQERPDTPAKARTVDAVRAPKKMG